MVFRLFSVCCCSLSLPFFTSLILWPFPKWSHSFDFGMKKKMKRKNALASLVPFKIFNSYIWFSSPISEWKGSEKSSDQEQSAWDAQKCDSMSASSLVVVYKYLRVDHDTRKTANCMCVALFHHFHSRCAECCGIGRCKDFFWNLMQL